MKGGSLFRSCRCQGSPRVYRAWPLAWPSPSGPHTARCAALRRDGLTASEAVVWRCAQLRGSAADLALGSRLVHRALAFWMQTTGATLLAVEPRSLVHVSATARDGRSACRLLCLAAVQDDRCQQEHGQVAVDAGLSVWELACPTSLTGASHDRSTRSNVVGILEGVSHPYLCLGKMIA